MVKLRIWLGFQPSEKYELVSWEYYSQWKNKKMFRTTKQKTMVSLVEFKPSFWEGWKLHPKLAWSKGYKTQIFRACLKFEVECKPWTQAQQIS